MIAVVKANGMGHGAVTPSRHLKRIGVERLAVATVEEGAELRGAGIPGPIHLLGTRFLLALSWVHMQQLMLFRNALFAVRYQYTPIKRPPAAKTGLKLQQLTPARVTRVKMSSTAILGLFCIPVKVNLQILTRI